MIERLLVPASQELVAYAGGNSRRPSPAATRRLALVAYAKVQLGCAEHGACRALAGQDAVCVPHVLAASDASCLLEPLHGTRLDHTPGEGPYARSAPRCAPARLAAPEGRATLRPRSTSRV